MASTAADVLNASVKRRIAPIEGLEPWGLTLFARSMTERERSDYESGLIDHDTGKVLAGKVKQARAALITRVVCDEDGKLIFSEDQVKALMVRDSKLTGILNDFCRVHVGLSKDEKKADSVTEDEDDSPCDSASPPEGSTSTKP